MTRSAPKRGGRLGDKLSGQFLLQYITWGNDCELPSFQMGFHIIAQDPRDREVSDRRDLWNEERLAQRVSYQEIGWVFQGPNPGPHIVVGRTEPSPFRTTTEGMGWGRMPREIQHKVLGCLPLTLIGTIRLVCRTWRDLMAHRWAQAHYCPGEDVGEQDILKHLATHELLSFTLNGRLLTRSVKEAIRQSHTMLRVIALGTRGRPCPWVNLEFFINSADEFDPANPGGESGTWWRYRGLHGAGANWVAAKQWMDYHGSSNLPRAYNACELELYVDKFGLWAPVTSCPCPWTGCSCAPPLLQ